MTSSAEGGPDAAPDRPVLIVANSPMREVESSESRLASANEEQPENATEIDTGTSCISRLISNLKAHSPLCGHRRDDES